jgi:tetratricopeptide (TPR) repeat protein
VDLLKEEIGNIRTAWQWAVGNYSEPEISQMLKGLWFFYEAQDHYEEALATFSRAAEQLRAERAGVTESIVLGQVLGCQGWFLYRRGLIREGKALLEQSVRIARQHVAWPETAFSLTLLGLVSNARGEYSLAREICQESLAISDEIGDLWLQSVSLGVLGNIARNLGEHEEARDSYQESLTISRATNDRLGMAISLNDLGQLAFRLGEYEKARQLCQESLDLSTAIDNQLGIAIAVDRLGKVAQALGEYDEAQRLCQESLERSRAIGDTLGVAISLNYLSSVACAKDDLHMARKCSEEALAICREIDNRRGTLFSLHQVASVAFLQGRQDEAHTLYQESLLLARQTGNLREIASAYHGLGDVAWGRGHMEECRRYILEALDAVQSAKVVYQVLETLVRVAHLLAYHGVTDRALDLVEVVRQHPAAWKETLTKLNRLRSDLEADLPADVVEAAQRCGQTGQLDQALAESRTLLENL